MLPITSIGVLLGKFKTIHEYMQTRNTMVIKKFHQ